MIVLLNAEAILFEVMQAAKGRMALSLEIPLDWVDLRLEKGDRGALFIRVDINAPPKEEAPEEFQRARLYRESKASLQEDIGTLGRMALREFNIRREGAGL